MDYKYLKILIVRLLFQMLSFFGDCICMEGIMKPRTARLKNFFIRPFLGFIAKNSCLAPNLQMIFPEKRNVNIDENTFIGANSFFANFEAISIGKNCYVANNVNFLTGSHKVEDYQYYALPITVRDKCWIGSHTVVLPGVVISEGCVIGANSLLNVSTEPYGVYVGNPAHLIKFRKSDAKIINVWGQLV